jgi:hypothetical protein
MFLDYSPTSTRFCDRLIPERGLNLVKELEDAVFTVP